MPEATQPVVTGAPAVPSASSALPRASPHTQSPCDPSPFPLPSTPRSPHRPASPAPTRSGGKGFLWHPFPRTHLAHWQAICPETVSSRCLHAQRCLKRGSPAPAGRERCQPGPGRTPRLAEAGYPPRGRTGGPGWGLEWELPWQPPNPPAPPTRAPAAWEGVGG